MTVNFQRRSISRGQFSWTRISVLKFPPDAQFLKDIERMWNSKWCKRHANKSRSSVYPWHSCMGFPKLPSKEFSVGLYLMKTRKICLFIFIFEHTCTSKTMTSLSISARYFNGKLFSSSISSLRYETDWLNWNEPVKKLIIHPQLIQGSQECPGKISLCRVSSVYPIGSSTSLKNLFSSSCRFDIIHHSCYNSLRKISSMRI